MADMNRFQPDHLLEVGTVERAERKLLSCMDMDMYIYYPYSDGLLHDDCRPWNWS